MAAPVPVHVSTASSGTAAASSLTWSHTCSGSNRYLRVGVSSASATVTVSSVTFNGVALTKLDSDTVSGGPVHGEYWYLIAPASTTANIVVTMSGSTAIVGGASSYTTVHQTTPHGISQKATGTSATATVTVASRTDELVVDAIALRTGATAITAAGGQTSRWNRLASGTVPTGTLPTGAGSEKAGAASVTMTWTVNDASSKAWVIIAVPLRSSDSGIRVYIGGVDKTSYMWAPTGRGLLRADFELHAQWTADFTLRDTLSTSLAYRPALNDAVIILLDGARVFKGKIFTVKDRQLAGNSIGTVTDVSCKAQVEMTDQVTVNASYASGFNQRQLLVDLALNHLTDVGLGLCVDPSTPLGSTYGALTFDNVSFAGALDYMSTISGDVWRFTADDILQMFAVGDDVAAFAPTAANGMALGPVTWEQTSGEYVNRARLLYGGTTQINQTFTATGTGAISSWVLDYDPVINVADGFIVSAGYVTEGGAYKTLSAPAGGGAYEYTAATNTLHRVAGSLGLGVVITLVHAVQYPQEVTVEDAAEIALRGLWAKNYTNDKVFTLAEATTYADGLLRRYVEGPKRVTLVTRQGLELPGTVMTLTFANRTLSGDHLITNVSFTDAADGVLEYTYTLLSGVEAQRSKLTALREAIGGGTVSGGTATGSVIPNSSGRFSQGISANSSGTSSRVDIGTLTESLVSDGGTGPGMSVGQQGASSYSSHYFYDNGADKFIQWAFGLFTPLMVRLTGTDFFLQPGPVSSVTRGMYLGGNRDSRDRWDGIYAGSLDFTSNEIQSGIIYPAQIVANTNNYNPTGLSSARVLILTTSASFQITGIVAQAVGTRLTLINGGSQDIVLVPGSASSSAGNRIITPGNVNFTLNLGDGMDIIYDGNSSVWRCVGF